MRNTRLLTVISGLSVAALLAGCAGSSGQPGATSPADASSSSTSPSITSAPASPATTSSAPPSSARPSSTASANGSAGLTAIVLRLSDLPSGWKSEAYRPDASDTADQAALLKCIGARNTNSDKIGEAHSADFSIGDATVSSEAERYRSDRDLADDQALLRNPKTISCYQKLTTAARLGLPSGSKLTSISFSLSPRTSGQPANVVGGLRAVISVIVAGQKAVVYSDAVFVRGPRIEAEIDFTNVSTRVPAAFRATLTAALAARAARA